MHSDFLSIMSLRRITSLLAALLLGITLSGAAFAGGGHGNFHGGGGHGNFQGGGGHGHFHGGGHGHHSHGHSSFGVFIGAPLFWPYYPYYYDYYYPSPYYYPPVASVPAAPSTYIEQGDGGDYQSEPAQAYWHYCAESNAYYPYVKKCPGGWQRVPAQPPANP